MAPMRSIATVCLSGTLPDTLEAAAAAGFEGAFRVDDAARAVARAEAMLCSVVESAETVAARLRDGLRHVPAERLVAAPDCGMKYLPRTRAFAKLKALAEGAAMVRRELAG